MKTQFSRRELYSLGEPLGESATHAVAGRRIYGGGGGGGGGPIQTLPQALPANPIQTGGSSTSFSNTSSMPQTPSGVNPMSQTDTQQGIAGYAQPYVNSMLGATMQNLFNYDQNGNATGMKQYNPYSYNPADYVAGFSPLQQQAQNGIAGLQAPAQGQQATDYANQAIQGLMGQQYNPQTGGYMSVSNQGLNNYQMGPAQQVGAQNFGGQSAQDYMNPYMQNVVDIQQREAQRQADIAGTQRGANAAKSGAFGGSRQAIMDAEAARNLATQKGDIQAQGLNSAYTNAQQQFNADQARQMAAQQANQQAGLTTGQNNLSALLGVQSLGAGQNLQAQIANQSASQQAQNLAAQQQQFGANYGMQGLQSALSGANTLGNLGTTNLNNQLGVLNAQQNTGNQQQQQQQNIINQGVSNYNTAQQYPMTQLNQMKGILSGLPVGTTSSQQYQAAPTNLQNLLALGMGGAGISQLLGGGGSGGGLNISGALNSGAGLLGQAGSAIGSGLSGIGSGVSNWWNGLNFAEGGPVKSYKQGGVTSEENVASIANFLPTEQLPKSMQAAQGRGDVDAEDALQKEMAERASLQRGLGGAFNQLPQGAQQNVIRAAGGGVVAFAKGGLQDTLSELSTAAGEDISATPEERMRGIQSLVPQIQNMYGPSKTAGMADEIAQERADLKSGKNMNQGYGVGLLKAAQAVLKPGGAMRGLGDAGAAFGEEVIKMNKENREADRLLRQSQITLAAADQARADGQIGKASELFAQGQTDKKDALNRKIGVLEKKATIEGGIKQAEIGAASAAAGHENTDFKSAVRAEYDAMVAAGATPNANTRALATRETMDRWGKVPGSERAAAAAGKDRIKVAEAVDMMLMKPGVEKQRYRELQAADKAGGTNQAAEYRRSLIDSEMGVTPSGNKGGPAPTQQAPAPKGPDLNTFMIAARKANPGVSDADLKAYYDSKYK